MNLLHSSAERPATGHPSTALRCLINLPWPVKRWIAQQPLAWRLHSGLCRRAGWDFARLGWHTASNGPYSGIHLQATHTNHLWVPMGTYETSISRWLLQLLTEKRWGCVGKDVWDVGAYRGYVSLLCAKHGKGRVLSFEPFEQNLQHFRLHLQANPDLAGRIEIVPVAVSDAQGEVRFLVRGSASECQILSPEVQLWDGASAAEIIRVSTLPLDSLLEQGRPAPGLVKIDIEGAEALALAGAARLLRGFHPVVLLEVHNPDASAASILLLREAGYVIRRIIGSRLTRLSNEAVSYGHLLALDPIAAGVL